MIAALFPEGVVTACFGAGLEVDPLHADEAASAGRMSDDRLREFAIGRTVARRALAQLGVTGARVPRAPDRTPIWPAGVVGSLTHCDDFCGAAVARRGPILSLGLDAEPDSALSEGAIARISTPDERAHLATLGAPGIARWAKLLFSAKESFYKCYYVVAHTRLGFQDADIRLDPTRGELEVRLVRADAPDAAGRRVFRGRFIRAAPHVFTAVTLTEDARY